MSPKYLSQINFSYLRILRVCIVSKWLPQTHFRSMSTTPRHQSFRRLPLSKPSDYSKQILIITFSCVIPLVIKFVAASIINMCTKLFSALGKNVKPNLFPLLVLVHIGIHHLLYHFETHGEKRKIAFFAVFRPKNWPKSHHLLKKMLI